MLFEPLAPALRAFLGRQRSRVEAETLDAMLGDARKWKPKGYDEHIKRRVLHYEGRAAGELRKALEGRYPTSGPSMSLVPLNLVRLIAEVDASVYDYPPLRHLVDPAGEKIEEASDAAQEHRAVMAAAGIDSAMIEIERRAAVADTLPVRGGWDPLGGAPELRPFWPCDVQVIPHPRRPWDEDWYLALFARVSGPEGQRHGADWYEVWTRAVIGEENGAPVFAPWRVTLASTEGDSAQVVADDEWPGARLPWVFLRNGRAEGGPFVWANLDLVDLVESLLVSWSNLMFLLDYQAHDELVLVADSTKKETIRGGPNVVHQVRLGEDLKTISRNPKIAEQVSTIQDLTQALAVSRRQSEDAYAWRKGTPETGVRARIKNAPQEQARREAALTRVRDDVAIQRVLIDLSNTFGGTSIPADLTPVCVPREPEDFEEPTERQSRAIDAQKAGLISEARAAVEAGWYPDVTAAAAAGLSDELKPPAPPPPMLAPPPVPDEDEPEPELEDDAA